MSETNNSVVATFNTHTETEEAVKKLQQGGFDLKKLSIVGKDDNAEEHVVGYYNTRDHIKYWGELGAFWGNLWKLLSDSAVFFIPGLGPVVIAGPLITWITRAIEGVLVVGGLSVIGAAFYSVGIPKDSILRYEESLKANKFILVFHDRNEEVEKVCAILRTCKATETNVHQSQKYIS